VAVLPWGATEAHNYHLPYGTDNLECEHIAAEAARLAWEAGARVVTCSYSSTVIRACTRSARVGSWSVGGG
jgi:creatinine amidohydrolase/Fe(II)-dependent formamide hydrolase-like protein